MRLPWIGVLVYLAGVCGCSSVTHDDLIKEQIRTVGEAATILEGVKDAESARAARPKLRQLIEQMEGQHARARKLALADAEDLRRVAVKNQPASEAALNRLNEAARQAAEVSDCREVVAEFSRDLGRLLR